MASKKLKLKASPSLSDALEVASMELTLSQKQKQLIKVTQRKEYILCSFCYLLKAKIIPICILKLYYR